MRVSQGFEPIGVWLDAAQEHSSDDCVMAFCNEPVKVTRYCAKHERYFSRSGTPLTMGEQQEIEYYRQRQWENTPEPPNDWESKHQPTRWGT